MKTRKRTDQRRFTLSSQSWAVVLFALFMILRATSASSADTNREMLLQKITLNDDLVRVRLLGVTEYEVTEMFNDLLMRAPGVRQAKRYLFRLDPRSPADCIVEWQVRTETTTPFQLESFLSDMIKNISNQDPENERQVFTLDPVAEDIERLRKIRPWRASANGIEFVMGRTWPPGPNPFEQPFRDPMHREIRPGAGFE